MAVHRNQVAALLRGLSPLQEKVVRLYFGIGCERSHSASEIARKFQVSSQAIGGILAGAQRKLAKVGLTPCKLAEAALAGGQGSRGARRACRAVGETRMPHRFQAVD
jgi:hypothetical protein